MAVKQSRRDFLGMAFGGFAAAGGIISLGAMKQTWDPLPSVQAAGFTTVDLSPLEEGQLSTVTWRGKPIFLIKKTADMPPPRPMDIPPFKIDGTKLVLGEEGPEYKKLVAKV